MKPKIAILLGSGPDVLQCRHWPKPENAEIIAINNAWKVRRDWDHLIFPEDFPAEHKPKPELCLNRNIHQAEDFVPSNNAFGGIVYCGGTMAFTAGYHVLHALKPDILVYFGCDMHYPDDGRKTHFYGKGQADPLRNDITLQNLRAKSTRLLIKAADTHCLVVNLSGNITSNLRVPRINFSELNKFTVDDVRLNLEELKHLIDCAVVHKATKKEENLCYFVPSGMYWNTSDSMEPEKIREIDNLWYSSISLHDTQSVSTSGMSAQN